MDKKGQVMNQLGALGVGVATLVIILSVTFLIMAQTGSQAASINAGGANDSLSTCYSLACNATKDLTTATATIPAWVPLIILVAIGGLILALVAVFGKRR